MKHCHFSILWNEIVFLKQKLPFLYEHFDQLIFYDLNVIEKPHRFSDDGSHEFIKNYPDPENKITLIEKTDLDDVVATVGGSTIGKMKMFVYGSQFVRDDMDVFWCTDMDEFFNASLVKRVDDILTNHRAINIIKVEQYLFWKNRRFITCYPQRDRRRGPVRIARHVKGNVYGHCHLGKQFSPAFKERSEVLYHFGLVGDERVRFKAGYHGSRKEFWDIWDNFDESKVDDSFYGFPNMHFHPEVRMGIKRYYGDFPDYLDLDAIEV